MTGSQHRTTDVVDPATRGELDVSGAGGDPGGGPLGTTASTPRRVRGHARGRATGARTVAAALAAALLAGAGVAWLTRPAQGARSAGSEGIRSVTPPPSASRAPAADAPAAGAVPTPRAATTPMAPAASSARPATPPPLSDRQATEPQRLVVRRLGIDMAVVPEGVARDGAMALPDTPAEVGWYRFGPRPGDPTGATVLAAHLDMPGYGIGPIAEVEQLRAGDVLTVRSAAATHQYRVTGVTSIRKTSLDLSALFARDGPPRLHLVTCGGRFDAERRRYDENVVVTAEPMA